MTIGDFLKWAVKGVLKIYACGIVLAAVSIFFRAMH